MPTALPLWELAIDDNGMIPTLNRMGHMFVHPDRLTQEFIVDAQHCVGEVLEIGSAFGVASLPVLLSGKTMTVNDLDSRHLDFISSQLPEPMRHLMRPLPGHFPHQVSLPQDQYEIVYASRVLHFVQPRTFIAALREIYQSLQIGGRFYFISTTPYIYVYREFIKTYENNKCMGVKWPGLIRNISELAPHRTHQLPQFINLMDLEEALRAMLRVGFRVDSFYYLPADREQNDVAWDGREHIGIVCVKEA